MMPSSGAFSAGVSVLSADASHACVVTTAGGAKCWGWNDFGQVGDGTLTTARAAVDVLGLTSGAVDIAGGGNHSCAVMVAGGIKCWGSNARGQLGDGGACRPICTPVDVCARYDDAAKQCSEAFAEASSIASGAFHSCVVTELAGAKCWGNSEYGQAGDGTMGDGDPLTLDNVKPTPVEVVGLDGNVVAVTTGSAHSCALTTAGGVKCWGRNIRSQLGDGTSIGRSTPVDVVGLESGVRGISTGHSHTCALMTDGHVRCWGFNIPGQLGDGTTVHRSTPVEVCQTYDGARERCETALSHIVSIDAGGVHTCAVTEARGAMCWGSNVLGELGDGTTEDRLTPADVAGLGASIESVSAGTLGTCALTKTGGVKCWGNPLLVTERKGCDIGPGVVCPRPVDVAGLESKATPGDVNCDTTTNSIDAALVLQLGAGLVSSLPCEAAGDVDLNGAVDSRDAVLVLQVEAGLR